MLATDIDAVARLRHAAFFDESERTIEDDAADLRNLIDAGGQQAALVAVSGGVIVGTCLLVANELDAMHDVSPWLAGLVVAESHRSLGIGAALVRAIETCASGFGFERLYLYTGEAEGFYERLGWSVIDRFMWGEELSVLMRRELTAAHPRP